MRATQIDVLTVMDEAANHADGGCAPLNGDALREARAVVAELIEATRKIKGAKRGDSLVVSFEHIADLAVALAKVQR